MQRSAVVENRGCDAWPFKAMKAEIAIANRGTFKQLLNFWINVENMPRRYGSAKAFGECQKVGLSSKFVNLNVFS